MSWYFEGRTYHNYAEYQSAKASADRRVSRLAAEEVKKQNRALAESIKRDREQIDTLRGDVKRQTEVNERIRSNVRSLERNQQRLDGMLADTERRMQQNFSEMQQEIDQQKGVVHGVQVDVEELRAQHTRHVEEVRADFAAARAETRQQFEEVHRQQKEAEQRLNESIGKVDAKVEHDRAERARSEHDQLTLAEIDLKAAAEAISRIGARADNLDLRNDLQQIENRLGVARTLIGQRNAAAALSATMLANADAGSLERKAEQREAELAAFQGDVQRRSRWIEKTLREDASQDMKDCYPAECETVLQQVGAARERSWSDGKTYSSFAHLRDQTDEVLTELEDRTLEIVSSTPIIVEQAMKRLADVEDQIALQERTYGGVTAMRESYAEPGDPKSDLVVQLTFGSSEMELRASLDGRISIDSYDHESAESCAAAADDVLRRSQDSLMISRRDVDQHNRMGPLSRGSERTSPVGPKRERTR